MAPPPRKITSVFTVVNLHCASCVATIQDALHQISPDLAISPSIINHTVTIVHPINIPVSDLSKALDNAGFEIYTEAHSHRASLRETLEQAIHKWGFLSPMIESRKRKRHLETCALCRATSPQDGSSPPSASSDSSEPRRPVLSTGDPTPIDERSDEDTLITVDSSASLPSVYKATVAISGMTCASCSTSITTALTDHPFVKSCNVNLLTNSATVEFSDIGNKDKLVQIIDDAGFDASIENVQSLEAADARGTADVWKATLAIEGMTCASCVGTVSRALEAPQWVQSVNVTLLTMSAEVVFQGRPHEDQLVKVVDDSGYEAQLEKIEPAAAEATLDRTRKLAIHVRGLFCDGCPERVMNTIRNFTSTTILKQLSYEDPVVEIRYTPNPPQLTIRRILDTIEKTDEHFTASIHHPISLEERSRMLSARERRHILYRLLLSLIIAVPSFIVGIVYMSLVPEDNANRKFLMHPVVGVRRADWIMFVLSIPVYFFAADMFHLRTLKELRALWRPGSPTPLLKRFYRFGSMNMLVSLGTSIAFFSSITELALAASYPQRADPMKSGDAFYFDSVVFLTMFLLLGRLVEAVSKAKTGDAVAALGNLRPTSALLTSSEYDPAGPGSLQEVGVDLLEVGDVVRVLHGASPPCDGIVSKGSSRFDESSLTGESKPVIKAEGDEVFAGTINKGSAVSVQITGSAGASMLDKIMTVVREGQARRAPMERLADMLTAYFVPLITLVAIVTWLVWLILGESGVLPDDWLDVLTGGWAFWSLEFAIAVFVVACPCGLGLAAPTALFVGGGIAAQRGILVKGGGEAFQEASQLDIVAFDKTGTLTRGGEPQVTDSLVFSGADGMDKKAILSIVRKLEAESSHPIARALVSHAESSDGDLVDLLSTEEVPGRGIRGSVKLQGGLVAEALAGNEPLMEHFGVRMSQEQRETLSKWQSTGTSTAILATRRAAQDVAMASQWQVSAMFSISDELRPEASAVVEALHANNIAVWMISGDNAVTARAVGAQVGIASSNIIAGVLPTEKADKVKYLQQSQPHKQTLLHGLRSRFAKFLRASWLEPEPDTRRPVVAFVGDGINDAPALTAADVSVAIGSGSDVALASASFVLLKSDLRALPTLLALSSAVFRRVRANFVWALIYNMLALPVAAGVLYPLKTSQGHVRLSPAWAALAMAGSSISVVLSSLALRTRIPLIGFREKEWTGDSVTGKQSKSLSQRAIDAARKSGRGGGAENGQQVFVHAGVLSE